MKKNNSDAKPPSRKVGLAWLITAALATILVWQFPWGNYALYPFTILATWFHEMGHGLTALVLGGQFHELVLNPNGSGLASYGGHVAFGNVGRALVTAGGPLGPSLAGALFILAGRRYVTAHYGLILLGIFLFASLFIWVRSLFGWMVVGTAGVMLLLIAFKSPKGFQGFTIQFLGVQACVSVFLQLDYLFTRSVVIGGRRMLSDTGQIADYLFLPYQLWGVILAGMTLLILMASLWIAYR